MEHANSPVRFELGERRLALLFNFRALRLLKEYTGIDFLVSPKVQELFNVDNLPRLIWAATQNSGNGFNPEWPTIDWIEETLTLQDMERVTELIKNALPKGAAEPGNAPPEAIQSPLNGSTSGPLDVTNLVATLRRSGN